jgi:murein DD-endopeptidase MepM/ murein hydrolase activator NlpD
VLANTSSGDKPSVAESRARLEEIEQKKREIQEKLREARIKEQIAMTRLSVVRHRLNDTRDQLNQSQNKLVRTENKINECERSITRTQSEEEVLSEEAGNRLRQIYEGQRFGLLEMLFQVSSLQHLLDLFYYQERIAEMDRKLLEGLRARAAALAAKKNQLGSQKSTLGDMVSEFAQKALKLGKEKSEKEIVAEKLRAQRAFYEKMEDKLAEESLQLERQIVEMTGSGKTNKNARQGSGTMAWPIKAPITSPFGWRRHPIFGVKKFHTGIDLAGPNHSPIKAADSGHVLFSGWYGGYGKVVIIGHGKGISTLYAHLSKAAVSAGANVSKGDTIGYEGSTGFSTGPHLHFEVRVNGKPQNPMNFLR